MSNKTPEQRASERWPETPPHAHGFVFTHLCHREGYATCIREEVEPLEAENAKLRALLKAGEELAGRIWCGCGGDLSECGQCNAAIQQWFAAKRDLDELQRRSVTGQAS